MTVLDPARLARAMHVASTLALMPVAAAQTSRIEVELDSDLFELTESFTTTTQAQNVEDEPPAVSVFLNGLDVSGRILITLDSKRSEDADQDGIAEVLVANHRIDLLSLAIDPGDVVRIDVEADTSVGPVQSSGTQRVRPNAVFFGSSRLIEGDTSYEVAVDLYEMEHLGGAYTVTVNGVDITPLVGVHDTRVLRDVGTPPYSERKSIAARLDFSAVALDPGDQVELAYTASAAAGVSAGRYEVATVIETVPLPPPPRRDGGR